jgi:dTDP-4-dehydrorhamnose reductase
MRVVILGGSGMLGHKLWQALAPRFDTYVTFRQAATNYERFGIFDMERSIGNVSAENFDSVISTLADVRPQVVVNCIGIVKQDAAARDPVTSIGINALFPHRLAQMCRETSTRLIHLSTDCVFSGRKGNYSEHDTPDAEDLYGRSKLLGEVSGEHCLTIRTSMIGRELSGSHGLVEWFLSQKGPHVQGFKRAVFSGFTTNALSSIIAGIIAEPAELSGIYHVAAEPITKFDLLTLIKQTYGLEIEIDGNEAFVCDRSLNGSRFREQTGFLAPSWPEMIRLMHEDLTSYREFRRADAAR